ncbi:MAG: hypothetical protein OXT64_02570, partial [Gammaproteobacteria bacterium]|nr:hypothetical protein [Gammaproteobacteria bacterium]
WGGGFWGVPPPGAGAAGGASPVSTGGADSTDADAARLVRQVKLAKMGYEGDAPRRRRVLSRLFDVMTRANGTFTLSNVHGSMERTDEDAPSSFSDIVKYARILRMGGALVVEESPEDVFFRDRSMSLTADISTVESMILAYESTVTTRLVVVAGETPIDAPMVCAVLGLDHHASVDLAYCEEVLESARCRAVELAKRGT